MIIDKGADRKRRSVILTQWQAALYSSETQCDAISEFSSHERAFQEILASAFYGKVTRNPAVLV
jgi:hypothetical protein